MVTGYGEDIVHLQFRKKKSLHEFLHHAIKPRDDNGIQN